MTDTLSPLWISHPGTFLLRNGRTVTLFMQDRASGRWFGWFWSKLISQWDITSWSPTGSWGRNKSDWDIVASVDGNAAELLEVRRSWKKKVAEMQTQLDNWKETLYETQKERDELQAQTTKKDKFLLQRDKARTLVQDIYDHGVYSEDPIPWDEIDANHDWFNRHNGQQ